MNAESKNLLMSEPTVTGALVKVEDEIDRRIQGLHGPMDRLTKKRLEGLKDVVSTAWPTERHLLLAVVLHLVDVTGGGRDG